MTENIESRLQALEAAVFAKPAEKQPWQELLDSVAETWGGEEVTYDVVVGSILNDLALLKRGAVELRDRQQLLAQIVDVCNRYYVDPFEVTGSEYDKYPSVESLLGFSIQIRDLAEKNHYKWKLSPSLVRRYAMKWLIQTFEEGQS